MLDRERIEKQEMKACAIAIAITSIVFIGFSIAINMTARCEECGRYVHRWQPAVYTSDGGIHHYGCLEEKYRKEAKQ